MAKKILRDGKDKADRLRMINEFSMVYELNMDSLKSEVTRLFNLTKASNA